MGRHRAAGHSTLRMDSCMEGSIELPDRNDSSDERSGHDRRSLINRWIVARSGSKAWLTWTLCRSRGRDDAAVVRLLFVEDQRVTQPAGCRDQKSEQVQPLPLRHATIDDQQVEWLASRTSTRCQKLVEALHRCHPKVVELVEQPLDFHAIEVLFVGDQDAKGLIGQRAPPESD